MLKRVKEAKESRKAVFMTFITRNCKPYEKNTDVSNDMRNVVADEIMIFYRADHRMGFIGGSVEPNETELEALKREVNEEAGLKELNIDVEDLMENLFMRIVHTNGRMNFILYVFEVDNDEFIRLESKISSFIHSDRNTMKELRGLNVLDIYDPDITKPDRGMYALLHHPMATSVREELCCILLELRGKDCVDKILKSYNNNTDKPVTYEALILEE